MCNRKVFCRRNREECGGDIVVMRIVSEGNEGKGMQASKFLLFYCVGDARSE